MATVTDPPAVQRERDGLLPEDRNLVDMTTAVLVDPNLHTGTQMRLAEEITGIVRTAHEDLHRRPLPAPHVQQAAMPAEVRNLLTDVLVDPNLHTDLRFRLHREIGDSLGRMSSLSE